MLSCRMRPMEGAGPNAAGGTRLCCPVAARRYPASESDTSTPSESCCFLSVSLLFLEFCLSADFQIRARQIGRDLPRPRSTGRTGRQRHAQPSSRTRPRPRRRGGRSDDGRHRPAAALDDDPGRPLRRRGGLLALGAALRRAQPGDRGRGALVPRARRHRAAPGVCSTPRAAPAAMRRSSPSSAGRSSASTGPTRCSTGSRSEGPRRDVPPGLLQSLPLDDGLVDLVTCGLALTHVEDLGPVFAEFTRVLRTGGHVVTTDLHPVINSLGGTAAFPIEDHRPDVAKGEA